jgi:hypothetical protein
MKLSHRLIALAAIFSAVACSVEAPREVDSGKAGGSNVEEGDGTGDSSENPKAKSADGKSSSDGVSATKPGASTIACNEAPPASLPEVTSEFLTSAAPAMKGGEEKGTWLFTKVTAYMSKSAGATVDLEGSKVDGSGFTKFDGTRFVTSSNLTQTIKFKLLGSQESTLILKIGGTYTYENGHLTFTTECSEGTTEGGKEPTDMGFSRISDTEALFHQTVDTPSGKVIVVTTMKKAG